jgi:hypothetical protein
MASNNLPGIGHNEAPDYAKLESDRLRNEYAAYFDLADEIETECAAITVINRDDDSREKVVELIKKSRDFTKRVIGVHELEKMPHFRRGQGVDNTFFGLVDRIAKRAKANKDGASDRLGKMLTDHDSRILAEEQERRRLEAKRAAEEEAKRIAAAAEAARIAEEARLAAERARKPETQEVKAAIAEEAEQAASAAHVETVVAASKAEEAHVATLVKPADIMRTRTGAGTLSTMAQEPFAEIIDTKTLDLEKLRPYFALADLQKALNGYARSQGHSSDASVQIAGARFGKRAKSVVR